MSTNATRDGLSNVLLSNRHIWTKELGLFLLNNSSSYPFLDLTNGNNGFHSLALRVMDLHADVMISSTGNLPRKRRDITEQLLKAT